MQLTQAVELEDPVSHYSFACTIPFGHYLVQTSGVDGDPPTQAQYISIKQFVHPSPAVGLPSSHCSTYYFFPSPQLLHKSGDAPLHVHPASKAHTALHPSPEVIFPSSQVSVPSFLPLPHN